MSKIRDITDAIEEFAPLELQLDFDNCGYACGNPDEDLTKALITLDLTPSVAEEAVERGCNLIIAHHPPIFNAIKSLDYDLPMHKALVTAIKNGIAVYAAHTNFDYTKGGLNDRISEMLGAVKTEVLGAEAEFVRIGTLEKPIKLSDFAEKTAKILNNKHILTVGDPNTEIRKFGVINGGGGGSTDVLLAIKRAGADIFISSDFKYHVLRLAKDFNYAIMDFGHYDSEMPFIDVMAEILSKKGFSEKVLRSACCYKPFND